ncbi:MAG: hypothetical protein ABI379_11675 [Rhodanobacter sp.]
MKKLHGYLAERAGQANVDTNMNYDGLDDPSQLGDLISYPHTLQ